MRKSGYFLLRNSGDCALLVTIRGFFGRTGPLAYLFAPSELWGVVFVVFPHPTCSLSVERCILLIYNSFLILIIPHSSINLKLIFDIRCSFPKPAFLRIRPFGSPPTRLAATQKVGSQPTWLPATQKVRHPQENKKSRFRT